MSHRKTESKPITNVDIVVYALASLGGAKKTVFSEDIAATCFELAPSRFLWQLDAYRKKRWPDKNIAKTALVDAKKKEYGALVDGAYALDTAKDGWNLTGQGVIWIKDNVKRIEHYLKKPSSPSQLSKQDEQRFLRRIKKQPLFQQFTKTKTFADCSIYDFTDLLNCSPDASPKVIKQKFDRLYAMANLVGDKEIISFFDAGSKYLFTLLET